MPEKIHLVEVNYHHHAEYDNPASVISKHRPSNLVLESLKHKIRLTLFKHTSFTGDLQNDQIGYRFFKGNSSFYHIPGKTHDQIRKENPDMVLVQGFIFPIQVIMLRRKLGKRCRIFLQHQGDLPGGKKIWLQRLADRSVDGYFFRSKDNARIWLKSRVIRDPEKVHELPDASTWFSRVDKQLARKETGLRGSPSFLWVGRLDNNKDPLTVLRAFELLLARNQQAKLYIISPGGELFQDVMKAIGENQIMKDGIKYIGEVPHESMQTWFSAADYYIASSHHEGGSYALLEAMACGCIPIVSAIPAAMQMTGHGKAGYSFIPGNSHSLFNVLTALDQNQVPELSDKTLYHFTRTLSPDAAADRLFDILMRFNSK